MMPRFEIFHDAGSSLLHSKRVWLIQLLGNALLFALFAGWLLLPVATELHVLLNAVAILGLAAVGLVLHAGTLNFYFEQSLSERPLIRSAFGRAVKHVLAIGVCVGLLFAFWALLDLSKPRLLALPFYLRSLLPDFIRVHLAAWWIQIAVEGIVFAIRWIVIPGLILPLVVESANSGFRAFGKLGLAALRNSVKRASYWMVLLLAAVVGCVAPVSLLDWTPEFKNPTLHLEAVSLIARFSAAYILAVASWLLVCSIVGRFSRPDGVAGGSDASGNSAA
jgi:hypothetical protein